MQTIQLPLNVQKKTLFDKNCELLLVHLNNLEKNGKLKLCKATTKYLAKSICKSERQTYRYLQSLEKKGLIQRNTSPLKHQKLLAGTKLYKLRTITCKTVENAHKSVILNIYFNKDLTEEQKKEATKKVVKSENFIPVNVQNASIDQTELARLNEMIISKMREVNYDHTEELVRAPMQKYSPEILAERELVEKLEAEEALRRKMDGTDQRAKENAILGGFVRRMNDKNEVLEGNDSTEKAVSLAKQQFEEMQADLSFLEPKELLEYQQGVATCWLTEATLEDGEYHIVISLGGEIPFKIKLVDYLPDGKNSPYYAIFDDFYQNKDERASLMEALMANPIPKKKEEEV